MADINPSMRHDRLTPCDASPQDAYFRTDVSNNREQPNLGSLHLLSTRSSMPPTDYPQLRERQRDQIIKRLPRKPRGYSCAFAECDKLFDTQCQLNKHSRNHIPGRSRRFSCPKCFKGFNDARELRRHAHRKTLCHPPRIVDSQNKVSKNQAHNALKGFEVHTL